MKKLRTVRRLLLATGLATLGVSGVAQAACPTVPTSQAFKAFGDNNYYALAPGGGFESGMAAWTLGSNSIASNNERFFLNGSGDARSLNVAANRVAVSPAFCVSSATPTLRVVAKKLNPATTGQLKIEMLYRTSSGDTKVSLAGMLAHGAKENYSDWKPSNILKLGTALPLSSLGGQASVQLRVSADGGGSWQIDDVYVDPRFY